MSMSMKKQIETYKRKIWNAGGKLPVIKTKDKDMQIAKLSSRLHDLTGKNC